jgi:hypothetical protein
MNETKPAQTPAEGILLHKDFGKSKFYKISCDCGNPDDEVMFDVEADEHDVTAHFYNKVKTNYWDETWRKRYDIDNAFLQNMHWFGLDLVNGLWKRIKLTWKLWVYGYVEYESWTMMSKQQTLNLAATLASAVNDVEVFRKEYDEKHAARMAAAKENKDVNT